MTRDERALRRLTLLQERAALARRPYRQRAGLRAAQEVVLRGGRPPRRLASAGADRAV